MTDLSPATETASIASVTATDELIQHWEGAFSAEYSVHDNYRGIILSLIARIKLEREQAVRECLRTLNEDSSRSWDECYDAILALLPMSYERSAWKTIQTAPKDGTVIFAFSDEAQTPKAVLTWFDGEKWLATGKRAKFVANPHRWWPTDWQPLPTPPLIDRSAKT